MLKRLVKYGCVIAGFLVVTGVLEPRPAAAQSANFAAGYSFLRDNEISENFPSGLFASVGVGVNSWLALAGEVASNRKKFDDLGEDVTLKVDFYGGGPRFVGHSGRARPYGQVLFGAARGKVSLLGESESGSNFAWQPGAGVDAYFSRSVGMRFGVNGRFISADGDTVKEIQVIVGIVFGGGH
jgi:hypothetical protein